jgi:large subunit ribosomal protein L32
MAVPKSRTSKARRGKRRSHHHVRPLQTQYCAQCEQPILPHHLCSNCGYSSTQRRVMVQMEEEEK